MELDQFRDMTLSWADDGVLLVTIERDPEHFNPVDEELHRDLSRLWPIVDEDPGVRAVVVTGSGRGFCAGGDMAMEYRMVGNAAMVQQELEVGRALVLNMLACDTPVVSAINGPAVGAGLAVALLADISIIAEDARITDGHARIGLAAGDHAALLWPLLCGMAKAKHLLLTADSIDGQEAERIGLVSKCVPRSELLSEALQTAQKLAGGSQAALRFTKRSLNLWLRSAQPIFEASLALEMLNFFSDDVVEGLNAFSEKRPARFPSAVLPVEP